jgi:hypothetical protein
MKLKNLKKKIRQLEARLQKGSEEASQAKTENEGDRGSKAKGASSENSRRQETKRCQKSEEKA